MGRTKSLTDRKNNTYNYNYDELGNLTKEINPLGNTINYQYDEAGNLATITDPMGYTSKFNYDSMNRLIQNTDEAGARTKYKYDGEGNTLQVIDPLYNTTKYGYDENNRLTKVTDALNNITNYEYDKVGNLTDVIDAKGNETQLTYDELNRIIQEENSLGNKTSYGYDTLGNITSIAYPEGNNINYSYDLKERLIQTNSGDDLVTFEYDKLDNVTHMTSNNLEEKYTYDNLSNIIQIENATLGKIANYEYDEEGNLTKITDPEGKEIAYTYDELGRITSLTDSDGETTSFEYDDNSNIIKIERSNGVTTESKYDDKGQAIEIITKKDNETISSFRYNYDYNGNIVKRIEEDGAQTKYTYDPLYRLTKVTYPKEKIEKIDGMYGLNEEGLPPGKEKLTEEQIKELKLENYKVAPSKEITYQYDEVGNRIKETKDNVATEYTYDNGNRLITAGNKSFSYDDNGNVTKETDGEKEKIYTYNNKNQLENISFNDETELKYKYDGYGRKVKREETYYENETQKDKGKTKEWTDNYLYAGWQVIKEYEKEGEELSQYYIAGDKVISRKMYGYQGRKPKGQPIIQPAGLKTYYHYDGLGNVMDLTDIKGDNVAKFRYSAFGEVFSGILSPYNHLGITGKEYDAKSGLMHYATRWYNPSVGRFIQPDSYKGKIYTPNQNQPYVYVGNNPINRIDPTGHESDLPEDMDWDQDGVMDSDQDDSDTFDQDDDGVADWNQDDTEDEWEYNDDTGWDWEGPGGSGGNDDDDDDDDDDNSPPPPPAYITRDNEFNGQAGGVTEEFEELDIDNKLLDGEGIQVASRGPSVPYSFKNMQEEREFEKSMRQGNELKEGSEDNQPTVRVYGIEASAALFMKISVSVGISYEESSGRTRLVASVKGGAGLSYGGNVSLFSSKSYDARLAKDYEGDSVDIVNIEGGHIIVGGKSYSKSYPDKNGKQTTWETSTIGVGSGIDFGSSGGKTFGTDIDVNIDLENNYRYKRYQNNNQYDRRGNR